MPTPMIRPVNLLAKCDGCRSVTFCHRVRVAHRRGIERHRWCPDCFAEEVVRHQARAARRKAAAA